MHVTSDISFGGRIELRTIDARLSPPDLFHCTANDCHDLRSFLLVAEPI
jgi:hypothetical protein